MSKDLFQRLSMAIIGVPALLCIFFFGGLPLLIFMTLLTAISCWEFCKIQSKRFDYTFLFDYIPTMLLFNVAAFFNRMTFPLVKLIVIFIIILSIRTLLWSVFESTSKSKNDYLLTLFGWLYIGFFAGLIYRIGYVYHNQRILLLLLVLIWITDSAAYFIGMRFGKHRGIFPVSPKKSLEGFLAGVFVPIVFALILAQFTKYWKLDVLILSAFSAGVMGQFGDLLESKVKRIGGVKDSSDFIPGHGGFLDRFDSLLIAGPFLFVILNIIP